MVLVVFRFAVSGFVWFFVYFYFLRQQKGKGKEEIDVK